MKVLITSGPTSIPIDPMRVITNRSTGEMGRLIANAFMKKRCHVTLLEGKAMTSVVSQPHVKVDFDTFDEFSKKLFTLLKKSSFDIIVHAAAVSDFQLQKSFAQKMSFSSDFSLHFIPTKKIIQDIKKYQPKSFLIGFKLESDIRPFKIEKKLKPLFNEAFCDLVIVNRIEPKYSAYLMMPDGKKSKNADSKKNIVDLLMEYFFDQTKRKMKK